MPETTNKRVWSGSGIAVSPSGGERPRTENDWYPTDPAAVEACYRKLPICIPRDRAFWVLDPGAGTGVWGEVLRRLYPREEYPHLTIVGFELDARFAPHPAYNSWNTANFLSGCEVDSLLHHRRTGFAGFDYVIGNPPYDLDTEFLAQAFRLVREDCGRVDFLYRLGFLASEERVFDFYERGYAASTALVFNTRPSFLPPSEDGSPRRATYPGDFTLFSWQFRDGGPDGAKRFEHLVYRACKTCGSVFFPLNKNERYCHNHTAVTADLGGSTLSLGQYVFDGYRNHLEREIRRAQKQMQSALDEGRVADADVISERMHQLRMEQTRHLLSQR